MHQILKDLEKLLPEQKELILKRYQVLKAVWKLQPTGRRSVSAYLNLPERTVRTEAEKLIAAHLVESSKAGMTVTKEGETLLRGLKEYIHDLSGLEFLEKEIKELLQVKQVLLVGGNCDENEYIKMEIGLLAAELLQKRMGTESVLALTGGSTVAAMVENVPSFPVKKAKMVVSARGIVGHDMKEQSDTLASLLAQKLCCEYSLLNVPDSLSAKTMNEMKNEPILQNAFTNMQLADTLVFGIGDALSMAKKRRVSETVYDFLVRKGAIAEAFGYYFNEKGEIVYTSRTLSYRLEDIKKIPSVLSLAGGKKKARAILALSHVLSDMTLILDEGAAKEIKALLGK